MNEPDNYIAVDQPNEMDFKIRKHYQKTPGWLPFETFNLVQAGYPYPDHGQMVLVPDGGIDAENHLLPPEGMWVKTADVRKWLEGLADKSLFG